MLVKKKKQERKETLLPKPQIVQSVGSAANASVEFRSRPSAVLVMVTTSLVVSRAQHAPTNAVIFASRLTLPTMSALGWASALEWAPGYS